eukprot:tig00001130_g7252.t1
MAQKADPGAATPAFLESNFLLNALKRVQASFVLADPSQPDTPIVFASAGFYKLTGYAPHEVIGRNCRFLQGRDTSPEDVEAIREAIRAGTEVSLRLTNYRKDGTRFSNLFYLAPLHDGAGNLKFFIGVQTDVSEEGPEEPRLSEDAPLIPRPEPHRAAHVHVVRVSNTSGASAPGTPPELALPSKPGRVSLPMLLQFENVSYAVMAVPPGPQGKPSFWKAWLPGFLLPKSAGKPKERVLLKGISGTVAPSELLAVMGPSGGGKTTLLNLLAGRLQGKMTTGSVLFNGRPRTSDLKRRIGYVLQDDVFFANLTVQETLEFTALLRLPRTLTKQAKRARVQEVMGALGLLKCAHTIIGNAFMRGVSGGERKRVNIACEMLVDPSLLLLDEPTSGLDSSTALQLMYTLRKLCTEGRTVVATLHQPSSQMFELYDKLLLVADGQTAFYGKAADAVKYFAAVGFPCPPTYNPADFLLGLLVPQSVELEGPRPAGLPAGDAKAEVLRAWEQRHHHAASPHPEHPHRPDPADAPGRRGAKFPVSWVEQFGVLTRRALRQKRGDSLSQLSLVQVLLLALLCGVLWFRMPFAESRLENRTGLIFFSCVFWGFFPLYNALSAFPPERGVLMRERASGAYYLSSYFMAKTTSEIPLECVFPTLFAVIVYWMSGLRNDGGAFIVFLLILVLSSLVAQSVGLFISTAVPNFKKALVVASLFMLASMLVGGFYVSNEALPIWIRWIRYVSFVKYSFEAMLLNEFSGGNHSCDVVPSKYAACLASNYTAGIPVPDILAMLGTENSMGLNVGSLVIMLFGFRFLSYLCLRYN